MIIQCFLVLFLIVSSQQMSLNVISEDEQIQTFKLNMTLENFQNNNDCLVFGIWTRYNPLSQIVQVGDVGILDSNCFNIHNVVDQQTEFSNFLYFDCVDNHSQTIKKIIQFIDEELNQHNFEIDLDPLNYENIWFYFGISIFPKRNKVQLIILQHQDQILFQNLNIMIPYYDNNLKATLGGGLVLQQSQRILTYQDQLKFSYFPGKMYYQQFQILKLNYDEFIMHSEKVMKELLIFLLEFTCKQYMFETFSYSLIKFQKIEKKLTENKFLYSFQFSGWIKAIEIHQIDQEFLYKLIKVSTNSENSYLTDDNLSPFQLLYRFEGEKQFLQILTYSYSFPSVSLDFSQNPFLIQKEVLLTKKITLWHYLAVQFEENQIKIDFTFYDIEDQLNLNFVIDVNHFHYMIFKILFGNILENSVNYINFRLLQFSYAPCLLYNSIQGCDQSCQSCDGPTSNDCLSCSPHSNRIYSSESKSCVCPYNMMDQDSNCIKLENQIRPFTQLKNSSINCQFGYFVFDENTCVKCPSNPNINTQSCLECIQNPLTWKSQATCISSLFFNQSDRLFYEIMEDKVYLQIFTFDSTNLLLCKNCKESNLANIDDIYQNYQFILDTEENILQYYKNFFEFCFLILKNCISCRIKNDQLICQECRIGYIYEDNQCKKKLKQQNYCLEPYYLNSRKQCSLCQIEYCVYCFEYLQNDLFKSTLYKDFEIFEIDEFHSVGCALCNEGFLFNSLLGKCIYQQPQIQNCLRSFINLNGQEVCTLSNLQTFDLSPEIDNCQNKISNCKQCIKTPSQIIKCIVCDDRYSANIKTGKCSICPIENSKICIQGEHNLKNAWIQLVQSFIMQFLNKKYFYPRGIDFLIQDLVLNCQNGYRPSQNACLPYCNSDCLNCVESVENFQCIECPLNSYNQIQRSTYKQTCLKCPKLCSICQIRSTEEIKSLNPYFIVTDLNVQYTYKCIQSAFKENIFIDPLFQIAKIIFENQIYLLNFDILIQCQYSLDYQQLILIQNYYEDCNQLGIENIQITLNYKNPTKNIGCVAQINEIVAHRLNLKQSIFSLKFVSFAIIGMSTIIIENNLLMDSFFVNEFDQIKFEYLHIVLYTESNFTFSNQNLIQLSFQNLIFSSDLQPINFKIVSTLIQHLNFVNVTFQSLNFTNTTVFNSSGEYLVNKINLHNIKIIDCYFFNTTLIQIFHIVQEIFIKNLIIENNIFLNSQIIVFEADSSLNINGKFEQFILRNNQFINTNCFQIQQYKNFLTLDINIFKCYFKNSNLYLIMAYYIDFSQLNIFDNFFFTSSILLSKNEQLEVQIIYEITNINLQNNSIHDSFLFQIAPKYQLNQKVRIHLNNLIIQKNQAVDIQIQSFLFYIHCTTINIEKIKILDQFNISFIYIYETQIITIQQFEHVNSFQNKIIPFGDHCQNSLKSLQVLKVYGFMNLKLENISLTKLNTLDLPFIELLSNIFWNTHLVEEIQIQNVNFTENIIFKQTLGKRQSQILIVSEIRQFIILREIYFANNLLHQTVDDLSDTGAGQIYIKSQQSYSEILDFKSINNWITNSSSSFFYAEIDFLSIKNYKCENLNIFNQGFLEKYLSISFNQHQRNQEEIQLIVQNTLSIQTKGSACFAIVRKLQIVDGEFKKIFSKTSPFFEIQTYTLGFIILENLYISQIDVIYESNFDNQGCIKVHSPSSALELYLYDIEIEEVINKFSPSIISITPSLKKNKLIFKNITLRNCISLKNQILKIEFSLGNLNQQNEVTFYNISIIQSEQAWIKYLEKIAQVSYIDLEKIMNDNALINLVNCRLTLQYFFIKGIIIYPIIRIVDSMNLKIINCNFQNIQVFYHFNLIHIEQNKHQSIRILFFQNYFRGIELFKPRINHIIENLQLNSESVDQICFLKLDNFIFSKINFTINSLILLLKTQQNQNQGSLLYLQSLSNQTKIYISQLDLIENNCDFCQQGLVFIDIVQIQFLQINQFTCLKNQITAFGCLNIQSSLLYNNKFLLSNSILGLNQGQTGTGIFFSDLKGIIKNSLIFNNSALLNGGGIVINSENNNFELKKILIFQNHGYNGGGLILGRNSNVNTTNFIQSYLEFNSANQLANNLIETPIQLNLQINNQTMRSNQEIFNNITVNILKLEYYNFLQSDKLIGKKYLLIPSNQKITDYKIFDQKQQFVFTNSYKEKLGDLNIQNCSVYQNIIFLNGSLISQKEKFIVYFNNETKKIELGDLNFTFDPYEQKNLIQQIEIFCKVSNNRALSYKINSKTFFCQLGEFYSQGGCQICEANQGFYSVTYNVTKCSIFDKTKFKAITSNTIQLLPGFWRPNYLSDFTELCFKETKYCLGDWKVGDQSCFFGHIGGLCEECDVYNVRGDGYFFENSEKNDCQLCSNDKSQIILFIFAFFLAIFSILITLNSISNSNTLFRQLKLGKKFGKIIFKLNQDHSGFLLKMFFNYLWLFSIIFTYNITFSINLNVVDQASNTSQFMATNLDCFLSDIQYADLIYIRIIGTIVFIFIQIIFIFIIFQILSRFQKSKFDYSNISNTCIYLYISNHASLTKQFCSLITIRVISNISYVQGNVSLLFYSSNHQNWYYYFILPGLSINGCALPLFLIFILYSKRNSLDRISVRKHVCYFFNEYKENIYNWEQIKIWQKTLIILILIYFEDKILLKTILLGLSQMLYQFLAIKQKPYIISNLNKLDIETGQICTIAIFLAALSGENTASQYILIFIQIIITALCLLLVYQYISVIFKVYAKMYTILILYCSSIFFKVLFQNSNVYKYFQNLYTHKKAKMDKLQNNYDKLRSHFNHGLIRTSKLNIGSQSIVSVKQEQKFGSNDFDSVSQFPYKVGSFEFQKLKRQ